MGQFAHVILTQDWHPPAHASFANTHQRPLFSMLETAHGPQTLWPEHCIQGTRGADFHPDLDTRSARLVVRKGARPGIDSYSAFFENDRVTPTGLAGALRELGVDRVVCVGLATDFCVRFTALDAVRVGLKASVIEAAVRGITSEGVADAWTALAEAGVERIR
jgi:nicotinamidase/pyrazinamidase